MSSRSQKFMSSRIQFPPWCKMLLSVGNYSVASNNESCHREQKRIVFDGDHLVTTGTEAHIYQGKKASPTSHSRSR